MRIHSSFHDYYDHMLKNGFDPKINYVRETNDENWFDDSFLDREVVAWIVQGSRKEERCLDFELIGFCGEIIPVIHPHVYEQKRLYSVEEVQTYLKEGEVPREVISWLTDSRVYSHWGATVNGRYEDVFKKYKVPVFYARREGYGIRLVLNPCLKNLEFIRKYQPYEAWQKLSQYVGNVLVQPTTVIEPIPDKLKAETHGFNKYSFRKDKKV